jgi:hypothetical protein
MPRSLGRTASMAQRVHQFMRRGPHRSANLVPEDFKMKQLVLAVLAALGALTTLNTQAVPTLQLNITGGTYDTATETVILDTAATSFTVNAYLQPDAYNGSADSYGLSVALVPKTGPASATLGSFDIGGTTVRATDDMTYGVPPIETVATQLSDLGDLSTHGIFDTYFYENVFDFSGAPTTASVNTKDTPGYDPTAHGGTDLFYRQFAIDVTKLDQTNPLGLHFDLYNRKICTATTCQDGAKCQIVGDVDQSEFASFSHDAEWVPEGGTPAREPATLALLGAGAMALGITRRRKRG